MRKNKDGRKGGREAGRKERRKEMEGRKWRGHRKEE